MIQFTRENRARIPSAESKRIHTTEGTIMLIIFAITVNFFAFHVRRLWSNHQWQRKWLNSRIVRDRYVSILRHQ